MNQNQSKPVSVPTRDRVVVIVVTVAIFGGIGIGGFLSVPAPAFVSVPLVIVTLVAAGFFYWIIMRIICRNRQDEATCDAREGDSSPQN